MSCCLNFLEGVLQGLEFREYKLIPILGVRKGDPRSLDFGSSDVSSEAGSWLLFAALRNRHIRVSSPLVFNMVLVTPTPRIRTFLESHESYRVLIIGVGVTKIPS